MVLYTTDQSFAGAIYSLPGCYQRLGLGGGGWLTPPGWFTVMGTSTQEEAKVTCLPFVKIFFFHDLDIHQQPGYPQFHVARLKSISDYPSVYNSCSCSNADSDRDMVNVYPFQRQIFFTFT